MLFSLDLLLRFTLALAAALGLLLLLLWLHRRLAGMPGRNQRRRSLKIREILPIDTRRKLITVVSADREYLLLIGGSSDVLLHSQKRPADQPEDCVEPTPKRRAYKLISTPKFPFVQLQWWRQP